MLLALPGEVDPAPERLSNICIIGNLTVLNNELENATQKPLIRQGQTSFVIVQMRLIQLHSDFIEYTPVRKEIEEAEENISNDKVKLEDLVVTLVAVEDGDNEIVVREAVYEIRKYLNAVKSNKLLIYPYAHLSSNLAAPGEAFEILKLFEDTARKSFPDVHRAPFGWTKAFNIKVKGHPLAENAKEINASSIVSKSTEGHAHTSPRSSQSKQSTLFHIQGEEQTSTALKAEEKLESSWYILQPKREEEGYHSTLVPIDEYRFRKDQDNLRKLADYEVQKRRAVDEQPPHVKLMKKLAIADYEPASDVGNMRYYPKGKLMKSLLEQYITKKVIEYGAMEVETPIMYDAKHPAMASYFNRFPARQYSINSDNKQLFLRFAACFGQFLMAKDFHISYRNLPLKLYELTRYSFRREKSCELVGLRRLRAFSMPDCHAFCKDMKQAKEEVVKRFKLSLQVMDEIGISPQDDTEMAIRFTEEFYKENKELIEELVSRFNRPVLAEMWKEKFFYFVLKWEFNYIDNLGKASALSTDQIDVENAARYNIEFVDEDGRKKNPIILHNSPSGAVERVIYALLEKAAKISKSGGAPSIPFWLAPTQVRLIPVNKEQHTDFCQETADLLSENNRIRADIDDRDESVARRIRDSESEWIRYTLVIGDKEIQTQRFAVRDRDLQSNQVQMTLEELIAKIRAQLRDKPYIPLSLARNLSERPQIMV
jgi:threonyl-tRNA synthetase